MARSTAGKIDPLASDVNPSLVSQRLRALIEAVVLALSCLAPWAYGGVLPGLEFLLECGVALALLLWALLMLIEWQASWSHCPLLLCLSAVFLLGIVQLISMPVEIMQWVSPGSAQLYEVALPDADEVLPFGQLREPISPSAGSTLSLYPAATRQELVRLLAALLLYVIIRNNLTSTNSLRRLCLAATINGGLLALFGYVQFFTSPHNMLYWVHPSAGDVFGPFVNRNHFAFYINLCLGLNLGLYLAQTQRNRPPASSHSSGWASRWRKLFATLHRPESLWLSVPLALMLSSVAFCLSRGGLLALGITAMLWLLIAAHRSGSLIQRGAPLAAIACCIGLLVWFGFDRVASRFSSTWSGGAAEVRLQVWTSGIGLVRDFPVLGTGYGTFAFVEPMHRPFGVDGRLIASHADNDYLEALVEGGVLRLLLSLLAIGVVLRHGYRATLLTNDRYAASLALGALLGFTTLVLHSFVDFGLHIPAIAMLAAAIAAHLCTLGSTAQNKPIQCAAKKAARNASPWSEGFAPLVGAGLAIFSATILFRVGWAANQVAELRFASSQTTQEDIGQKIASLASATELCPDDATLHLDLAIAHLEAYQTAPNQSEAMPLPQSPPVTAEALEVLKRFGLETPGQQTPIPDGQDAGSQTDSSDALARYQHLLPALRHLLMARDCCPVLPSTQMWIASNSTRFDSADPQTVYLERAKLLAPADADLWYACGFQEILQTNEPFRAWESWQHSLELSEVHLADILDRSAAFLDPPLMMSELLPERPAMLFKAATYLYPDPDNPKQRRPLESQSQRLFFTQALELLGNQPDPLSAEDLHLQAQLLAATNEPVQAIECFRAALLRDRRRIYWRLELARLLRDQYRYEEAQREVTTVLGVTPTLHEARALAQLLANEIASGKADPRTSKRPEF